MRGGYVDACIESRGIDRGPANEVCGLADASTNRLVEGRHVDVLKDPRDEEIEIVE